MKILNKCQVCKKRKLFIKHRSFKIKAAGLIVSKDEMCGDCQDNIKKALKDQMV